MGEGRDAEGWGDLFHACAARDMIPEYSSSSNLKMRELNSQPHPSFSSLRGLF